MEFINEWKEKEVEMFIKEFNKATELIDELREKYGLKYATLERYHNIPTIFKVYKYLNDEGRKELAIKETEAHFKKLQAKVENKIGKILQIKATGENGYDYSFIGENGNCKIEVILAGGYNIQRAHTRWIIKK